MSAALPRCSATLLLASARCRCVGSKGNNLAKTCLHADHVEGEKVQIESQSCQIIPKNTHKNSSYQRSVPFTMLHEKRFNKV